MRIRTKLIVAFLAVGLVPVLVLGIFSLFSTRKALQKSTISQVHALLDAKVERVQDTLRHAEKDLRLLSQSPSIITFAEFYPGHVVGRNNLNRMLISTLENFAQDNPLYGKVLLLNPKGEQVLQVTRNNGRLMIHGPVKSENFSRENFFWKALDTRRGEIVITTSMVSGGHQKDDRHILNYSTAVYDRGQRQKGILTLQILIKDLARRAISGERALGNSYLLDSNGTFLFSIDTDEERSIRGGFPGLLDEQRMKQMRSGKREIITGEKHRILAYAPILYTIGVPGHHWVVVIDLARSVVLGPVLKFLLFFALMVVILTFIGITLGMTASRHLTRPILKLHEGARRMAAGNFDHPITVNTNDEINDLAEQFNDMADRLRESRDQLKKWNQELQKEVENRTQQLIQAEKMATLGGFSAGIAHEIGNPLAAMKTNIQILEEKLGHENVHSKFFKRILNEIDRLNKFYKTFSSFARPVKPKIAPFDIRIIIQEVMEIIKREAAKHGVIINLRVQEPLPLVIVDFQRMQQVFLNLFLNAIQAMPEGGAIKIELKTMDHCQENQRDGNAVMIKISDTGTGIPEAVQQKIFEPFFTTKPKGTGLGLSIVHQIVRENGGTIAVESTENSGTTFTICLNAQETANIAVNVS